MRATEQRTEIKERIAPGNPVTLCAPRNRAQVSDLSRGLKSASPDHKPCAVVAHDHPHRCNRPGQQYHGHVQVDHYEQAGASDFTPDTITHPVAKTVTDIATAVVMTLCGGMPRPLQF